MILAAESRKEAAVGRPYGLATEPVATVGLHAQMLEAWPQPFSPEVADKLVVGEGADVAGVAAYARLAEALEEWRRRRYLKTVLLTSAGAGEGRTLTAANLALTFSEFRGARVLLVDLDVRAPHLHPIFHVSGVPGLHDYLRAPDDHPVPLVQLTRSLALVPAGRPHDDPFEALASARMRRLLVDAATTFDWVVLDGAPVSLVPDSSTFAALADANLLVIDPRLTSAEKALAAVDRMGRGRLAGVVLNARPGRR